MEQVFKQIFRTLGYDVRRVSTLSIPPVEFSPAEERIFRYVKDQQLTMVSYEGVAAAMLACKHAVLAGIDGDFVECGVWRGGVSIAAKMTLEEYGSDKKVWLFDTFAGMTEPTEDDRGTLTGEDGAKLFGELKRSDHVDWCYASLEDVQRNFERSGANMAGVRFVKGDVAQTLADQANLPAAISVLRLDADFYESTRKELEVLYPRLAPHGSLLLDHYGYWDGARKAVEEYFGAASASERPLLFPIDRCARVGIKP